MDAMLPQMISVRVDLPMLASAFQYLSCLKFCDLFDVLSRHSFDSTKDV